MNNTRWKRPARISGAESRFIRQMAQAQADAIVRQLCIQRYGDSYNTNYPDSVGLLVCQDLAEYFRLRGSREIGPPYEPVNDSPVSGLSAAG
jgi:hypothetical protein